MTKLINKEKFDEIVFALKKGEVVAFPTDTVYGLGVVYNNYQAQLNLKAAKSRLESKPLPLMVSNLSQLKEVAFLMERDEKIVEKLTPGALTLVLNKKDVIEDKFTNGFKTIAVRMPNDEFVLKLLDAVGPMWVTSANISDKPSATNHQEAYEQLNNRIDMIVEGTAESKIASTIIDCTGENIKILRQGEISIEDINKAIC